MDGDVWPLTQLEQHLGGQAFRRLQANIARAAAQAAAAAVGEIRAQADSLQLPADSCFELLGGCRALWWRPCRQSPAPCRQLFPAAPQPEPRHSCSALCRTMHASIWLHCRMQQQPVGGTHGHGSKGGGGGALCLLPPRTHTPGPQRPPPPTPRLHVPAGLDFLVGADLHPWLLECNATPSLAVEHSDAATQAAIHAQKNGMVRDMVSLLRLPARFAASAAAKQHVERALRAAPGAAAAAAVTQAAVAANAAALGRAETAVPWEQLVGRMVRKGLAGKGG